MPSVFPLIFYWFSLSAAQQIIDEFECTFERIIGVEGILDYLEVT